MVIITEDIIRKSLDESINEFMINEGGAWDGVKNWANRWGLDKVWNGVKNAAAMYMDSRTNGQWNQKYGIYVNGNTKTGELYYLNKWFKFYYQKLNSIISNANNPSQRDEYETWERDANNPNREYKKINKYDYVGVDGALEYAKKYCTFQNFNDYVRGISPDRMSISYINTYIFNYITKQAQNGNLKAVLNNLNINTFYSSKQGQAYLKMDRNKQQNTRKKTSDYLNNRQTQQQQQSQQQQQTQQGPVPDRNGKFTYPSKETTYTYNNSKHPEYKGWIISYDKNNASILIHPKDPTKAVFMPK